MNRRKLNRMLGSLITMVISCLFFAGYIIYASHAGAGTDVRGTGVTLMMLYLALIIVMNLILWILHGKRDENPEIDEEFSRNLTMKMLTKMYLPVMIVEDSGKIVWYNNAAKALFHTPETLRDRFIDQFTTVNIESIVSAPEEEGIEARITRGGKEKNDKSVFRIKAYPLALHRKNGYVVVWNNKTDLYNATQKLLAKDAVVAYVMIDNLDELQQYVKGEYRYLAAKVDEILKNWAQSINGVLKEYEKDRYLLFFEASYLNDIVENRFPVLDEVRQVHAGSNIPVTVSMGVVHIDGTLSQKEELAQGALDTALQRGGDQVVYRDGKEMYYFGGRTKTMQKRTKVRSRVVASELAEQISLASNVLVMGHANADHDSIASCVGVARLAMHCGTPVKVCIKAINTNVSVCIDSLGDKPEYEDVFIDPTDAMDVIGSQTLLVICDVNNERTFEAPELYENIRNTVIIDHHRKTNEFRYEPLISYIDPSASSASELLAEILEQTLPTGALPKAEADLLLSGIQLDTNYFTRNAGIRTFVVAQYLRSEGGSPADAKKLFRTSMEDYLREANFQTNVSLYKDEIAIAIHRAEGDSTQDRIAAAKVADKLLNVTGVNAAFALVHIDDTVYISARSGGDINVQLILEQMGGGGHFDVAGAQLVGLQIPQAVEALKKSIDSYMEK